MQDAKSMSCRLYLQHGLWLLLSGVLFWYLETRTGMDGWFSSWYFDASLQRFPLQDAWWLELLNHRLLKDGIILFSLYLAWRAWRQRDGRLALTVSAMLLATALVSLLKSQSLHACPWELQAYGGTAEYFALFAHAPANTGEGRCFPGGHASGGFSLMLLYFYYQPRWPQLARYWLAGGLLLGMLMGWGQLMRGAHFLSHNLWSGWLVWLAGVLLFAAYDGYRQLKLRLIMA